jgi:hypothetical protein
MIAIAGYGLTIALGDETGTRIAKWIATGNLVLLVASAGVLLGVVTIVLLGPPFLHSMQASSATTVAIEPGSQKTVRRDSEKEAK